MSQLDHTQGDPLVAPSRIGYSFYVVYISNFADLVVCSTPTSLSLLRFRDGVRSSTPVTLTKGPYWSRLGFPLRSPCQGADITF